VRTRPSDPNLLARAMALDLLLLCNQIVPSPTVSGTNDQCSNFPAVHSANQHVAEATISQTHSSLCATIQSSSVASIRSYVVAVSPLQSSAVDQPFGKFTYVKHSSSSTSTHPALLNPAQSSSTSIPSHLRQIWRLFDNGSPRVSTS
jgi:hypothetical protein